MSYGRAEIIFAISRAFFFPSLGYNGKRYVRKKIEVAFIYFCCRESKWAIIELSNAFFISTPFFSTNFSISEAEELNIIGKE